MGTVSLILSSTGEGLLGQVQVWSSVWPTKYQIRFKVFYTNPIQLQYYLEFSYYVPIKVVWNIFESLGSTSALSAHSYNERDCLKSFNHPSSISDEAYWELSQKMPCFQYDSSKVFSALSGSSHMKDRLQRRGGRELWRKFTRIYRHNYLYGVQNTLINLMLFVSLKACSALIRLVPASSHLNLMVTLWFFSA